MYIYRPSPEARVKPLSPHLYASLRDGQITVSTGSAAEKLPFWKLVCTPSKIAALIASRSSPGSRITGIVDTTRRQLIPGLHPDSTSRTRRTITGCSSV
mmetsp:Transcript_1071/g.2330  ORF Transcript_1071/g.2330 Transcript_1071/m.2330 type:complete len:99 (-) Transcript_1071:141-437(-)